MKGSGRNLAGAAASGLVLALGFAGGANAQNAESFEVAAATNPAYSNEDIANLVNPHRAGITRGQFVDASCEVYNEIPLCDQQAGRLYDAMRAVDTLNGSMVGRGDTRTTVVGALYEYGMGLRIDEGLGRRDILPTLASFIDRYS